MVRAQGLLADVDTLTEELIRSVVSGGDSAAALLEQSEKLRRIDQNLQQAEQQLALSRKALTKRARRGAFKSCLNRQDPWSPEEFLSRTKATFETVDEFDEPDFKNILPEAQTPAKTEPPPSVEKSSSDGASERTSTPPPLSNPPSVDTFEQCPDPPSQMKRTPDVGSPPAIDVWDISDDISVPRGKRSPATPRVKDFIMVKQGWLEYRDPDDPDSDWENVWCVLHFNGDFVYYRDEEKTRVRGYFQFLPDSTIHSFDNPRRMEVVPAYMDDPNSAGIHFKAAEELDKEAWTAAIAQPEKYIEVMNVLRKRGDSTAFKLTPRAKKMMRYYSKQ